MRSDAPRTAYSGYPLPHQPAPEVSTVCLVPPRAQPVTRDSRNRATRARHMKRVRSPYMQPLEEERPNAHIKCGNTRTASRTPDTYTIFQLGLMNQDAGTASSIHREPGPCTRSHHSRPLPYRCPVTRKEILHIWAKPLTTHPDPGKKLSDPSRYRKFTVKMDPPTQIWGVPVATLYSNTYTFSVQ